MYGGGKNLIIVSVYNRFNWEVLKDKVKEIMEEKKDECVLIGGDFNARIGLEGDNDEERWNIRRKTKDKMANRWGRVFGDGGRNKREDTEWHNGGR